MRHYRKQGSLFSLQFVMPYKVCHTTGRRLILSWATSPKPLCQASLIAYEVCNFRQRPNYQFSDCELHETKKQ